MSARPIATATLSFGLVSVPVKLYSTGEPGRKISFNWLHAKCGTRLRQRYYCPKDGESVERDEMIKGYEFAKEQYVTFKPEELKALEEQGSQSIDITEFVPADEVERIYLDRPYYLGPDKGGERAYRLLSAALQKTGRAAIAKYATRGKQYLVMVRPRDEGLILEQLLYPEEIRSFSEVPLGEGEVKEQELELAVQLIDQAATEEFRPENYRDEVRERVLALIQQKVDGEEITHAPTEEPKTQIIDLMAALKASLAGGDDGVAEDSGLEAETAESTAEKKSSPRRRKQAS
ncbi:MAG: Ku protein [Gemmatimonadota bacterium]|nr:MAG: Ku protein [Gemmatimonadota bacterium]